MQKREIFISAGEISGDLHGAALLGSLRRLAPGLAAFGIGGRALEEAGMEKVADIERLSLVGVAEVLPKIPSILRLLRETGDLLARRRPRAVVLIDSPDFNLRLAARARRLGLKVIYYIGPTVWAWRPGRVAAVRESVDLMLTILPFEERIYRDAGVRALYVGNPLVDDVAASPSAAALRAEVRAGEGDVFLSLLPGSRGNEVRRHLPVLVEAARILARDLPGLRVLVPAASPALEETIRCALGGAPSPFTVVSGRAGECLSLSRAAVVTSGTATLEAALRGTPFLTVYRLSPLSWLVGRLLVKTPWISLPSIVVGEEVVEELIQGRCTPGAVAASAAALLEGGERVAAMRRRFEAVRQALGPPGSTERAAEAVAREAGLARP